MKKIFLIIFGLVLVAAGCNDQVRESLTQTFQVGNSQLIVEIADTPNESTKGLSDREFLPENHGMLFVFNTARYPSFWMKDTLIPLDFIWIAEERVVDITHEVPVELGKKDSELSIYTSKVPVDSMLEVNAGWARKNQVKIGDPALFPSPGNRP